MTVKTYKEISDLGLQVLIKQKNDKHDAMDYILTEWNRLVKAHSECKTWYEIIPNLKCGKCGAPVFKVVGPFIPYTPGSNPAVGCVSCSTVSSAKTLCSRDDIIKVN